MSGRKRVITMARVLPLLLFQLLTAVDADSPCNCMTAWTYLGEVYEGCAETPDWQGNDWCYVQGGANCAEALETTMAGEDRMYRQCSPCNCMTAWNYLGEVYEGCTETPDWQGVDWCYVQGGADCAEALESTMEGEDRMFMECVTPSPAPPPLLPEPSVEPEPEPSCLTSGECPPGLTCVHASRSLRSLLFVSLPRMGTCQ